MASEPLHKVNPKDPGVVVTPNRGGEEPLHPKIGEDICPDDGSVPCGGTGKGDKGL
jgi:hypothetical protein